RRAPQRSPPGGAEQAGQIHEPARGILAQQGHELAPVWALPEAPEGLQHGQIRLPCAVRLDTLPVPHREILSGCCPGEKCRHQGGLADTWFPRDDPYLPGALARRSPPLHQLGKFGITPDKVQGTTEEREPRETW